MTGLLGLTLDEALSVLKAEGMDDVRVERTQSPRHPAEGTARVVRISEDGRRLTVACFPDRIKDEDRS